jgi:hypothetical protein
MTTDDVLAAAAAGRRVRFLLNEANSGQLAPALAAAYRSEADELKRMFPGVDVRRLTTGVGVRPLTRSDCGRRWRR